MRLSSAIGLYISLVILLGIFAFVSIQLYIIFILLFSLIYIPIIIAMRNSPSSRIPETKEEIIVDEDITHFREKVNKALNGKAVAQRDIELRLLNTLVIDLSIRYDISEMKIRKNLENEYFLRRYVGEKAEIISNMYKRRHDLRKSLSKERFLKEINDFLEVIG